MTRPSQVLSALGTVGLLAALGAHAAPVAASSEVSGGTTSSFSASALLGEPVDVARAAGVYELTRTFSVNPVNVRGGGRDSLPRDFFFVRHNPQLGRTNLPPSTLWENRPGGTYADAGTAMFGHTDKHGCAWGDYNLDGRPDMACAIGFGQNSKNELWRQNTDGSFTNVAGQVGITKPTSGRYRYVTFIHANGDLYPDLYFARYFGPSVPNDPEDPSHYPGDEDPNELWINRGHGDGGTQLGFQRDTSYGLTVKDGARKDAASCAQPVDFDRNGTEDLLVCGEKNLKLYRHRSHDAPFQAVENELNVAGFARDAAISDLDGDGVYEFVKLTAGSLTVRRRPDNGAPWSNVAFSMDLTAGESLAIGDTNGDGLQDIFVVAQKGGGRSDNPDYLLVQEAGLSFDRHNLGTTRGSGDDVGVIDYNRDGLADFIVANGDKKRAGPVQLFTWKATPPPTLDLAAAKGPEVGRPVTIAAHMSNPRGGRDHNARLDLVVKPPRGCAEGESAAEYFTITAAAGGDAAGIDASFACNARTGRFKGHWDPQQGFAVPPPGGEATETLTAQFHGPGRWLVVGKLVDAERNGLLLARDRARIDVRPEARCAGKPAGDHVIIGTPGNDVLEGTPGRDVICGRGGNDTIRGRGGNDTIYGGARADTVYGNGGNDVVYANRGRDRVYGGKGSDVLEGGAGADELRGGPRRDRLAGGPGDDLLVGGAARDTCRGGKGRDRLRSCEA